ncbi:N-formylglutamate amidohydrolase [Alkalicella caledoniensis]|uniref:N-formylglutamate amidohydrolase n=1 Tax=Alkalicella caledoniensis TaxID=2731377 RepID=UPI001FE9F728|nr:N-formylglutamate amidohydrolase [Alkalicella caledoniensis]
MNVAKSTKPSNIIASIPHGSSSITSEMRSVMRDEVLLTNNDWFLNELFSFLNELNITTVSANYSRYLIDVNRDIGKKEIDGDYTDSLIYRKTTFGKEICTNVWTIENRPKGDSTPFGRFLVWNIFHFLSGVIDILIPCIEGHTGEDCW